MSNYLQLQTSLFGDAAQSAQLATRLVEALATAGGTPTTPVAVSPSSSRVTSPATPCRT